MRLTTFFLIVVFIEARAECFSQQKITLSEKNMPLEEVFKDIRQQTGYNFLYSNRVLTSAGKINVEWKNVSIEDALRQCLMDQPLSFSIVANTVIIKLKSSPTQSQDSIPSIEVSGKVTDSLGTPLAGVTVHIKNSAIGVVTNGDGKYSIVISEDGVLVFSFIGYTTLEQLVSGRTTINVSLSSIAASLDAVTVIGYGTQKKSDLTGSISSINAKSVSDIPGLRVDQMLQGKASGMMVTQTNGSPGASSSIRIRGNSSITASSEPLYIIDGLIGLGDLSTVNPSDIADITVLKDASATAIYGSRGANGVILITTKKGAVGPAQINVNIQQGWQWLPRKIDLLSGSQYAKLLNESRIAVGGDVIYDDPEAVQTTDWQEETMQIAPMINVNTSTSGGSEKIRYFLAGNYYNQEGIIKNTGVERLQFRANVESHFNDKIKVGVNINAGSISTDNNTVPAGSVLTTSPSMPIYNPDGTYNDDYPDPQFNGRFNTPVASQNLITSKGYRANLTLNAYAEYSPLDWLTIRSTYGGQMIGYGRDNSYTNSQLPGQTTNQQFGVASIAYNDNTNYQNENTISFTKAFNNNHVIDGVVGLTYQGGISQTVNANAKEFISDASMWNNLAAGNPITRGIGSGYENWSMTSYLARINYKFKDRYLVTVTGREDGSSRLGAGNKWATFPSIALGWIASEENYIKGLNIFSFLKLRASYGKVGNQSVGIYQTMSILTSVNTIVDGTKVSGWVPGDVNGNISIIGNPDLKWEIKDQLDLGIEANFFDNRLSFSFDYYNAKTSDLLLLAEIPSQTGYTQQMANVGKVDNRGFDITIHSDNIENSRFKWSTQLTVSHNENEVLHLGPTGADVVTHIFNQGLRPAGVLRIGEPIGSFLAYVSDGIWKETQGQNSIMPGAVAGSVRYRDINKDGQITQEDCIISGNGSPSWYGGLGSYFSYNRFGLDIFFSAASGAKIFNGNASALRSASSQYNHYPEVADRWDPITNPNSNVPGALNFNQELYPSDRWIFDASYIRLESINLYYRIPLGEKAQKYIKSANISLTGSNLFCLSPYDKWGFDPVVNQKGGTDLGYNNSLQGFDYGAYPKAAVLTIGANLTF